MSLTLAALLTAEHQLQARVAACAPAISEMPVAALLVRYFVGDSSDSIA